MIIRNKALLQVRGAGHVEVNVSSLIFCSLLSRDSFSLAQEKLRSGRTNVRPRPMVSLFFFVITTCSGLSKCKKKGGARLILFILLNDEPVFVTSPVYFTVVSIFQTLTPPAPGYPAQHRTVCKNRIQHLTCEGQSYAKQCLNCRNLSTKMVDLFTFSVAKGFADIHQNKLRGILILFEIHFWKKLQP